MSDENSSYNGRSIRDKKLFRDSVSDAIGLGLNSVVNIGFKLLCKFGHYILQQFPSILFMLFLLRIRHVSSLFILALNSINTSWVMFMRFTLINIAGIYTSVDILRGRLSPGRIFIDAIATLQESKKRKDIEVKPQQRSHKL